MTRSLPSLPLALASLLLALAAAAPASAATPIGGAAYRAHDHTIEGQGWHVDALVDRAATSLKQLVLYAEPCGGRTAIAGQVPIGAGGELTASGPAGEESGASYAFEGRFATSRRLEGSFRITAADGCDTGPIAFVARTRAKAHRHADGGQHSHHSHGHPVGTMPDLRAAPRRALRQAERLWRASLRTAARRFPTIGAAVGQGYVREPRRFGRPVIYHVRSPRYERDGATLDPRRPESLVYYWPGEGEPVLVAFMFRRPVGRAPRFAAPLLAWHSHTHDGRRGRTQMTHVWMTNGLRSALANCLPIRYLEHALGFGYRRVPTVGAAHESAPCPGM